MFPYGPFPPTARARWCPRATRRGFTFTEMVIATAISSLISIGLTSMSLTAGRMDRSISHQQLAQREAQAAIEGINAQIRQAGTTMRILNDSGAVASPGNRVEFSLPDDAAPYTRAIYLTSKDANIMTPEDNRLMYDPNTSVSGDEIEFAHWLAPISATGAFAYAVNSSGAQTPGLTVQMRAGDAPGSTSSPTAYLSGPGRQGVEVNITVAPRN